MFNPLIVIRLRSKTKQDKSTSILFDFWFITNHSSKYLFQDYIQALHNASLMMKFAHMLLLDLSTFLWKGRKTGAQNGHHLSARPPMTAPAKANRSHVHTPHCFHLSFSLTLFLAPSLSTITHTLELN